MAGSQGANTEPPERFYTSLEALLFQLCPNIMKGIFKVTGHVWKGGKSNEENIP